jgi:hypothetical protein
LRHVLGRLLVGDIDLGRQRLAIELLDHFAGNFLRRRRVDIGDHDLGSRFGEAVTIGPPDAMPAARNDDDFVFESLNHAVAPPD